MAVPSRFVLLSGACSLLLTSLAAQTQPQTTHADDSGQVYTITRIHWDDDLLPLSTDAPGTFNFALAGAMGGPAKAEGAANAFDELDGYDACATATDWHHSEWRIAASNAAPGFILSVGGSLSASGWTEMVNPPCSAFAACAHSAKVTLSSGTKEAGVYLSGAATSESADDGPKWGKVTVEVRLPGVTVGWEVHPVWQGHQTGQTPIGGNGAELNPKPGEAFGKLDAWGVGTSCTLFIESGVSVKAYANGWWALIAWDASQAKARALTSFSLEVGGRAVEMRTLEDLEPVD